MLVCVIFTETTLRVHTIINIDSKVQKFSNLTNTLYVQYNTVIESQKNWKIIKKIEIKKN